MRAFISYSHSERHVASMVSNALESIGVESFMAHDNLRINEEWRERILREIMQCDLFVALISRAYKESAWCDQEAGLAVGRQPDMPVFPISLDDTDPYGFLGKWQGLRIDPGEEVALDAREAFLPRLVEILPRKALPALIGLIEGVSSYQGADSALEVIAPHIASLEPKEAVRLLDASIANDQVWGAHQYNPTTTFQDLFAEHGTALDEDKVWLLESLLRGARPAQEWLLVTGVMPDLEAILVALRAHSLFVSSQPINAGTEPPQLELLVTPGPDGRILARIKDIVVVNGGSVEGA